MHTLSELDHTLLGLICLHPKVSGYELNRVIKESTGYVMMASFSQIYPALKKLHSAGLVDYEAEPVKNRLSKKYYTLTSDGEEYLQTWLNKPIEGTLDFHTFTLRMVFAPLMSKDVILRHIDNELAYRGSLFAGFGDQRNEASYSFLNEGDVDMDKVDATWLPIAQGERRLQAEWLDWLKDWRKQIESDF